MCGPCRIETFAAGCLEDVGASYVRRTKIGGVVLAYVCVHVRGGALPRWLALDDSTTASSAHLQRCVLLILKRAALDLPRRKCCTFALDRRW